MSISKRLPATTAHKAHYTALMVLLAQVILAFLGVTEVDVEALRNDVNELLIVGAGLLIPAIVGWLTTFYKRNYPK